MARSADQDFDEFVQAQGRRLLAVARVISGNDHDAWDLVQDSLSRVGARWSSIRNREDPFAYARRTLISIHLNRARRLHRERLTADPNKFVAEVENVSSDDLEWLDGALQQLSPRQRAAVTLAYLEDLPIATIADTLACSESSVRTHLSRGRAALRLAAPARLHPTPTPQINVTLIGDSDE